MKESDIGDAGKERRLGGKEREPQTKQEEDTHDKHLGRPGHIGMALNRRVVLIDDVVSAVSKPSENVERALKSDVLARSEE